MRKIKLESVLKWTACLCAFCIVVGATFFMGDNVSGEDGNKKNPGETINLKAKENGNLIEYTVNLSNYGVGDRVIKCEPNETGVTIVYNDGTFTYIDEYTSASENSINLSQMDISGNEASRIEGIYIAPGYEAILRDSEAEKEKNGEEGYTYIVNEEERTASCHTTRILGPINIKGYSCWGYMSSASKKFVEHKGGYDTGRQITFTKGKLLIEGLNKAGSHEITIELDLNPDIEEILNYLAQERIDDLKEFIKQKFEIEYSKSSKKDSDLVKIVNDKASGLLEDVYNKYAKSDYNEKSLDEVNKYVTMKEYNNNDYLSRVAEDIKLDGDSEDKREDVKIYNIRKIMVKKVSQKEGVYLMKGLYNVLNEENRYSKRDGDQRLEGVFEYLSPSIDTTGEENNLIKKRVDLKTNGHVNSIMVVGNYKAIIERENETSLGSQTEHIVIQGAKGCITCITDFWGNEKDGNYQNEISTIMIMPRDEEEDDSWEMAYYFTDQSGENVKKTMDKIKDYENFVKRYNMEKREGERSVTAYTKSDFDGDYLQFYVGELNNLGDDKEIETIGSLEVAPNTRVVFFDKEDIDINLSEVDYGGIGEPGVQNAVRIDGPAYISDLQGYFDKMYLENGELAYKYMDMKCFYVQYLKNANQGVYLYDYENGVGTSSILDLDNDTDGETKLNKLILLKQYVPTSISIKGNYFVKLYTLKEGKKTIERTIIGPVTNYNLEDSDFDWVRDFKEAGRKLEEFKVLLETTEKNGGEDTQENNIQQETLEEIYNNCKEKLKEKVIDVLYNSKKDIENIKIQGYKMTELVKFVNEFDNMVIANNTISADLEAKARILYPNLVYTRGLGVDTKELSEEARNAIRNVMKANLSNSNIKESAMKYLSEQYKFNKYISYNQYIWVKQYIDDVTKLIIQDVGSSGSYTYLFNDAIQTFSSLNNYTNENKERELAKSQNFTGKEDRAETYIATSWTNYERNYNTAKEKFQQYQNGDYANKLKDSYNKWKNSGILIGKLTQKDSKSRSLENTDGIVLYQNVNYNAGLQSAEDVWTHFNKDDTIDFTASNMYVEVDPDNIHSIKIVGSLAGKYEMTVQCQVSGITKTKSTRYNIPDISSFFEVEPGTKIRLEKITLNEVQEEEFEILLDTSGKTGQYVTINNFKEITTTENVLTKAKADTTYGLNNAQETEKTRKVYIASLEEIINVIEAKISTNSTAKEFARLDYVYEYDSNNSTNKSLVGVKVTRNIGDIGSSITLKKDKTLQDEGVLIKTYKDIDKNIENISREVEFKLNLLSPIDVLKEKDENESDIVLSDEFSYTKGTREVIITDHGYLKEEQGATSQLLEQEIELVRTDKNNNIVYNKGINDGGEILNAILNDSTKQREPVVGFWVECKDKSGRAKVSLEILNGSYRDPSNDKEYKIELDTNSEITQEGKKIELNEGQDNKELFQGDFTLLKDGGEIVAKVLLNISSEDRGNKEWTPQAKGVEYIMRLYLPATNSISKITSVGNSVISRTYKDIMEVPAMLVKEVENNQETTDAISSQKTKIEGATEQDADKILYVPVCYKDGSDYKTSFLLEQLGMRAIIDGGVIKIYY